MIERTMINSYITKSNTKKLCIFLTGGTYAPYATCMATPLAKSKASPYSITERRVPELIPILDSEPPGNVSHKPGGRLSLLSARPAVTIATLRGLLPVSLLGEQRHDGCEQFD